MLFWAELLRERIEGQKAPNVEFIPSVEIPYQYQHLPDTVHIEDVSESGENDRAEIQHLSQRLENVSPIQLISAAPTSTPFGGPTVTSTAVAEIATNGQMNIPATHTPATVTTSNPTETPRSRPSVMDSDMRQWRDSREYHSLSNWTLNETEDELLANMAIQMLEVARCPSRAANIPSDDESPSDHYDFPVENRKKRPMLTPPVLSVAAPNQTYVINTTTSNSTGAIPKVATVGAQETRAPQTTSIASTNTVYTRTNSCPIMSYELPKTPWPASVSELTVPRAANTGNAQYSKAVRDEIDRRRKLRSLSDARRVPFGPMASNTPIVSEARDNEVTRDHISTHNGLPLPSSPIKRIPMKI